MNFLEPAWLEFNGSYVLPDDEAHVWRADSDIADSDLVRFQQILSPGERERADRFHFEVDRRRAVIGRGYLRLLLGQIQGLPAHKLAFEYDEFGKPGLASNHGLAPQFNVSHSGGVILIAITMGRPVGVDIEKVRNDLDVDNIAARFFSDQERKILASLADTARHKAFFACWTRKEAYLKARGVGLSLPLDQFDVSLLPDEEPRLLTTRHDPADAARWKLWELNLSGDYAAALAAPISVRKLECWNCEPLLWVDGGVGK
jgi:4'-phosphopantetheinyl transferase